MSPLFYQILFATWQIWLKLNHNRKRSEAAKGQPRTEDGLFQPVVQQTVALPVKEHKATKAKAKASKTNAGAVARGDKLANDRPDLAKIDIIVMGQMSHVIHGRSIAGT
jgi:hypothetical protein